MNNLSKLFSDFKKHFVSVFSHNKKNLILGISLGLFLCFFSLQIAHAIYVPIVSEVLDLIAYVMSLPVRLPFFFLVMLTAFFSFISAIMFGIVASFLGMLIEVSLSVPIISGWVVEVGFEFTKNFANMFIILILAFIGLATILKMKEYEARKILPKLIMVALLINFTPVMVGFIVDIANLFTNFFFAEIAKSNALSSFGFAEFFVEAFEDLGTVMTINGEFFVKLLSGTEPIIGVFLSIIIKHAVMILFYTIASLTYLMVCLLFFARFIMLWILVILAPIAFFSQVLPESTTVKALLPSILHWNKWWETLIQWAVIGIPLGFFLYLSNWIIDHSDGMPLSAGALANNIVVGPLTIPIGTIIEQTIGPLVAIFMLIFGIMVSIESMPEIAKGIIKRAKGIGKGVGKRVGGGVAGVAAKRVAGAAAGTLARVPGMKKLAPGLIKYKEKTKQDWAKHRTATPEGFEEWDTKAQASWIKSRGKRGRMGVVKALGAEKTSKLMEEHPEVKDKLTSGAKSLAGKKGYKDETKMMTDIAPEEFSGAEIAKAQGYRQKEDIDKQVEKMKDDGMFEKFGIEEGKKEEFAIKALHMQKVKLEDTSKKALVSDAGRAASVYRDDPQFFVKAYEKLGKDKFNDLINKKGGINTFKNDKLYRISPRLVRASAYNKHFKEVTGRKLKRGELEKIKKEAKEHPATPPTTTKAPVEPELPINPRWPKNIKKAVIKTEATRSAIKTGVSILKVKRESTKQVEEELNNLEKNFKETKEKIEKGDITVTRNIKKYLEKTEKSISELGKSLEKRKEAIKSTKESLEKDIIKLGEAIKEWQEEAGKWDATKGVKIEEKEVAEREKKELLLVLKKMQEEGEKYKKMLK
ncbi:MAG: hypothetical protein ACKKMW_00705 [Candidatus Nealsonbacteria bacterium]